MEKPPNSTLLNICIIPTDSVSAACEVISRSFVSDNTMLTLGGDKFAHMTAYMARFEDDHIDRVIQVTKEVIESIESFYCEQTGYFMTEGRYLEVLYRRSKEFVQLHKALIAGVAGLRINPGQPYEEGYFTPYNQEQRQNAIETGYDLSRNLFRPHITLTRYKVNKVPRAFPALPKANLSFSLNRICIYKADDNGAVYERIADFNI